MVARKTTEQFIIDSKKVHGNDAYLYDKVEYKNNRTKVLLKCCTCMSEFLTRPTDHTSKCYGCPNCCKSKSEKVAIKILSELLMIDVKPASPTDVPWLKGLYLDGYCITKSGEKIGIEYQGIQHYKYPNYFHKTKKHFKIQQRNDAKKVRRCRRNSVQLILIPHTLSYKNVEKMRKYIFEKIKKI